MTCHKHTYASRESAESMLRDLLEVATDKKANGRLNVYLCSDCCYWHVGIVRLVEVGIIVDVEM
jgi:hypothetical protein